MKRRINFLSYEVYQMNIIDSDFTTPVEIDAFICFNAQEIRAGKALEELYKRKLLNDVLTLSFNKSNSEITDNIFQGINIDIITVNIGQDLSLSIITCLQEIDKYVRGRNSIGIDITCMPIPLFTQILHFLYKRYNDKQITVYYTEPLHYTLNNLFDYSAYSGEIDIKVIPGFEGEMSQVDKVERVVFYLMGFEMTYLAKLIPQDVNPNKIAPINGFPSYFPKYKDISMINNNTNFYEKDVNINYSEANNPFETYNTIVMLKNEYKSFKIDIVIAGSKPMALGACLFALTSDNFNCRIMFPFPTEYKLDLSSGCGKLWEYKIKNQNDKLLKR